MNDKIIHLVNLAKASEMMNVLKSIHDNFCARYRICSNCPLFGNCAGNAITESTRAIDENISKSYTTQGENMNPTKQHDIKDCSTCEHLMFVGAFHRPECSEQDYLPELVQENGTYKPIARGCKFYTPHKEENDND